MFSIIHHFNRIAIRSIILIISTFTVAGCAVTPSSTYYRLEQPADILLGGVAHGIAVGVGPLHLPGYLDRSNIVTRGSRHRLELSEFVRWAEPLEESMLRVIAANLSNKLESTRVFVSPGRRKVVPVEFQVEINVVRFDGSLGGDVMLAAQWILQNKTGQVISTKVSILEEHTAGTDYDALITAQNSTLGRLSEEIAEAIRSHQEGL